MLFLALASFLGGGALLYGAYRAATDGSSQDLDAVERGDVNSVTSDLGTVARPMGDQPYRLVIEKLGVDAAVGTYGLDDRMLPQVPYQAQLVAWYNFSAEPGTGDNAVFAGHRTWNGNAVFRRIDELAIGDQVTLRYNDGRSLVYRVTASELVDPAGEDGRSWMAPSGSDALTLITCGGEYYKTNDPIFGADYSGRRVIRAELVGSLPA